jgi:hypothetical protein
LHTFGPGLHRRGVGEGCVHLARTGQVQVHTGDDCFRGVNMKDAAVVAADGAIPRCQLAVDSVRTTGPRSIKGWSNG